MDITQPVDLAATSNGLRHFGDGDGVALNSEVVPGVVSCPFYGMYGRHSKQMSP